MSNYRFAPVSDNEAAEFWENSPHASVFTHPQVLQNLSDRVDWWMAWKGKEPACLWPVCMPSNNEIGLPEFTYYVGPMWSQVAYKMPVHRWLARSTEVYEGFIKLLLDHYGVICASLPVDLFDIRVFDWWNYHEAGKPRFQIQPCYTARINNLQKKSDETILAEFRFVRRYELRQIEKNGLPLPAQDWTTADIIQLYIEVMARQNKKVVEKTLKCIADLVDIVNCGHGEIIAYEDPDSNQVIAALLILYGKGVTNLVLNLVADSWRTTGLSSLMIFDSIKNARARGATCYDFNGANSPNRGDDKHSYGAFPVLYFKINYPEKGY